MTTIYTRLARIATMLERRVQLENEISEREAEIAVIDGEVARWAEAPEGGDDEISLIANDLRLLAQHAARNRPPETPRGG